MASGGDQGLSLLDLASSKVSQAQKLLDEVNKLLKQDPKNAEQEKTASYDVVETSNERQFGSKVKLNVGGVLYTTTLDTLRKDPDSMLCAMFSGRQELKPDVEDGAYFIDRDGKMFRYILNYLRDGDVDLPDNKNTQNELYREAKFYQIRGLIRLHGEKQPLFQAESSEILKKDNHISEIKSWLGPGARCSLLFRASIDGKNASDFHRCCDNKGPTLLLIRTEIYIYGGYTSKSWESEDDFKVDSESFLFTLVNPHGSNPVKLSPIPRAKAGICFGRKFGPAFGDGVSPFDLCIWNRNGSSSLNLDNGFTCPPNAHHRTYFTGSRDLQVDELEVFEVKFFD